VDRTPRRLHPMSSLPSENIPSMAFLAVICLQYHTACGRWAYCFEGAITQHRNISVVAYPIFDHHLRCPDRSEAPQPRMYFRSAPSPIAGNDGRNKTQSRGAVVGRAKRGPSQHVSGGGHDGRLAGLCCHRPDDRLLQGPGRGCKGALLSVRCGNWELERWVQLAL